MKNLKENNLIWETYSTQLLPQNKSFEADLVKLTGLNTPNDFDIRDEYFHGQRGVVVIGLSSEEAKNKIVNAVKTKFPNIPLDLRGPSNGRYLLVLDFNKK